MDRPQTFEEWLMSIHPPKCPDCHSQSCLCSGKEFVVEFTQEELDDLIKLSPYFKATSNDVDWLSKIRMQGRIQKWVDSAYRCHRSRGRPNDQ